MCRFKSHLLVALVTFGIGLLTTCFWIIKSNSSQCLEKELEPNKTKSVKTSNPIKESENPKEEYFQLGEDEKRLGIYHKVQPRSDNSYLYGQLSELAELFGKTKKNTFHISKIETDNERDFWLYVYWKEDNSILTLMPPFDKEDATYLHIVYGRRSELDKNIVRTEEEIGNSRKLLTWKIANELIEKCVSSGNKLTIEKGK